MESDFKKRKDQLLSLIDRIDYPLEYSEYYDNLRIRDGKQSKKFKKFLIYLLSLNLITYIEINRMDNLYKNGNNWTKDNPNIIIYVELFYTYYDKYIEYEQKRTIKTSQEEIQTTS